MPRTRPPYPSAFRRQMVELVRSERTPEELAREFEPTAQSVRNWGSRRPTVTQVGAPMEWNSAERGGGGAYASRDPSSARRAGLR